MRSILAEEVIDDFDNGDDNEGDTEIELVAA